MTDVGLAQREQGIGDLGRVGNRPSWFGRRRCQRVGSHARHAGVVGVLRFGGRRNCREQEKSQESSEAVPRAHRQMKDHNRSITACGLGFNRRQWISLGFFDPPGAECEAMLSGQSGEAREQRIGIERAKCGVERRAIGEVILEFQNRLRWRRAGDSTPGSGCGSARWRHRPCRCS